MGKSSKRKSEVPDKEKLLKKWTKFQKKMRRVGLDASTMDDISDADNRASALPGSEVSDLMADLTQATLPTAQSAIKSAQESQEMAALVSEIPSLDEEVLEIMGIKPESSQSTEARIQHQLSAQWASWIKEGVKKEEKADLLEKYPRGGNCPLEAPKLNAEIAASLFDTSVKRDKHLVYTQNLIGSALSALGSGITLLLEEKDEGVDKMQLLEHLCAVGKLLTATHHQELVARKHCIYPSFDKKVKTILEQLQSDEFLFGKDLPKKIKSAKTIEKVGLDIKPQPVAKKQYTGPSSSSNSGNWKGPSVKFQRNYQMGNKSKGPQKYGKQPQKQAARNVRPPAKNRLNQQTKEPQQDA